MKTKSQIQPLRLSRETIHRLEDAKPAGIDTGWEVPYTFSRLVWCVQ